MTQQDLAPLRDIKVATDWSQLYALIGNTVERVAGCSCSDIRVRFVKRSIKQHHPVFGIRKALGMAHIPRRTARVLVCNADPQGEWAGSHYQTLFHELGHIVWADAGRKLFLEYSAGQEWLNKLPHLHGAMAHESPYSVMEAFVQSTHKILQIAEILSEYQADVFALRVATRLAHQRGNYQSIAGEIERKSWQMICSDPREHFPLILLMLWRERGDLRKVAQEAKHLSVTELLRWFSGYRYLRRSEWYRMREKLSGFMSKRWQLGFWDDQPLKAEIQYQQALFVARLCEEVSQGLALLKRVQKKHGDADRCFSQADIRKGEQRFSRPPMLGWIKHMIRGQQALLEEQVQQRVLTASWAKEIQAPTLEAILAYTQRFEPQSK